MEFQCKCCGNQGLIEDKNILVTSHKNVFQICSECVDALWELRSPGLAEQRKETSGDGTD